MIETIQKIIKNTKTKFDASIDSEQKYVNFDLTKSVIEDMFLNSGIIQCVGVQPGNGLPTGYAIFYRPIKNDNGKSFPIITFNLLKSDITYDNCISENSISQELMLETLANCGTDTDNELKRIIKYENISCLEQTLKQEMIKLAVDSGNAITVKNDAGPDEIYSVLDRETNTIAIKTMRGQANFCIASPRICDMIISNESIFKFDAAESKPASCSIKTLGTINDSRQLLLKDTSASNDYILLGYKGKCRGDDGLIFCPNTMFMFRKTGPDELKTVSDYKISANDKSGDYYSLIKFE